MASKTIRCKTNFKSDVIESDTASALYVFLREEIEWEEGIRSRKGFTRKAKIVGIGEIPEVDLIIVEALKELTKQKYCIINYYLNYYENGDMWTPNHSHKGTYQLVISLGASRTLTLGKREFKMTNGSAIIFGGSVHGVPKMEQDKGRISIATFMVPIE